MSELKSNLRAEEEIYKPGNDVREQERKRMRQKQQLESRQKTIYNRAVNYANRYGEDDYRTETMLMFLEIAENIQEIIDLQETFQDIEFFFNDAMNIIDDNMKISDEMLTSQLETNYGFFARLKQKRKIKKAQRNNINRIKMLSFKIESIVSSVNGMSEEMRRLMINTKRSMERTRLNKKKMEAKDGTTPSTSNKELLAKYAKKFGDTDYETKDNDKPSAPSSDTKTDSSNDISDVL